MKGNDRHLVKKSDWRDIFRLSEIECLGVELNVRPGCYYHKSCASCPGNSFKAWVGLIILKVWQVWGWACKIHCYYCLFI